MHNTTQSKQNTHTPECCWIILCVCIPSCRNRQETELPFPYKTWHSIHLCHVVVDRVDVLQLQESLHRRQVKLHGLIIAFG